MRVGNGYVCASCHSGRIHPVPPPGPQRVARQVALQRVVDEAAAELGALSR